LPLCLLQALKFRQMQRPQLRSLLLAEVQACWLPRMVPADARVQEQASAQQLLLLSLRLAEQRPQQFQLTLTLVALKLPWRKDLSVPSELAELRWTFASPPLG